MAYRIEGLAPAAFESLFSMTEGELAARGAMRVTATAPRGFQCRVSLEDAAEGESLILLNHVSHDVATPYRAAFAIYVRAGAEAATYVDALPPMLEGRTLALRGFGADGMLKAAVLAMPGEADERIRTLLADPEIAAIHAHNAAYGCFAARIERA
jgi:hypothetical protein